MRVVVVGAGVSGLAAATFLAARGADVTVLEAGSRAGGNTQTTRAHGYVVDHAANGWLDSEPAMDRLLQAAGLVDQIQPASDRYNRRWIFADGVVHPLPGSPRAFLGSGLLSWSQKLRMLCEIVVSRGGHPDESVGAFARRRLGQAAVDRLVAPMVAGIFGGDADDISLEAAFPRMAALEREHRSLILAMIRLGRGGAPAGRLQTLAGGAGALPEALSAQLGARVRCGAPVDRIERLGERWRVCTPGGAVDADAVVLATPAFAQASLVDRLDPDGAAALNAVPYAPIAVVALAWPPGAFDRPPDGFGVLAARGADLGVLGALYASCIYPAQAPDGHVLVRLMLGGAVDPAAAALEPPAREARAVAAVVRLLGEPRFGPAHTWQFHHPRGIPQYRPGHRARVGRVRTAEARLPGLFFTGNHLDGIGVKDCARDAERVTDAVLGRR